MLKINNKGPELLAAGGSDGSIDVMQQTQREQRDRCAKANIMRIILTYYLKTETWKLSKPDDASIGYDDTLPPDMVENTSNSIKETLIESRKTNIGKAKIMAVMHTIRDMIHEK